MNARGFSLIELVVAMAVSLIAIAAGVVLLQASQKAYQAGTDDRALQESARVAMDEVLSNVRRAGYGLEPTFAFDPGMQADTVMATLPQGDQARFGGYCRGAGCVPARDSTTGPDELVFYARDPLFGRDVVTPLTSTTELTLARAATLEPGQVLQVMCYGAKDQWLWAYVTVSSVDSTGKVVTLRGKGDTALDYDFPSQNKLLDEGCYKSVGAVVRAFKVDVYRYYVESVDAGGTVRAWNTPGTRPYLMLDRGVGTPVAVAPDVEDFQVAYVFPLAPEDQRMLGGEGGAAIVANTDHEDAGFNLKPLNGVPSLDTPSLDPLRTTHHPANIRAIRIAITVRAPRQDPNVPDRMIPAALNRGEVAGEAGYRRLVFQSSAYARNMESRMAVFPTYDPNYQATCCPDTLAGSPPHEVAECKGNCGGG